MSTDSTSHEMHDMQADFAYLRSLVLSRAYPFYILTISDHFETARQENGANVSECLHNVVSVTSNVTFLFAPLATGPNFGSSDFIGSLGGQSEMTHNLMSLDPHNGVNSLDLILMRLRRKRAGSCEAGNQPRNSEPSSISIVSVNIKNIVTNSVFVK